MALIPFFPYHFSITRLIWFLIGVAFFFGCATNPATKKKEFMFVSEGQEFNIGRKVDKQVHEEMGIYRELPELRAYVQNMGKLIGKNSDRPGLIYRIEIVDTPDFNAFAVPGGFVYVHRGLLEKMNSADELASVMGHEMAHVAARHSASQISKSQLLNIGLLALDVVTGGGMKNYGQLIDFGSILAFSKFSRDDEREADHFGTKYMTAAGYNPKASIDMMEQLQKLHKKEPTEFEVWFMTHPPTSERIENLNHEVQWFRQNQPQVLNRPIKRNEFIALLDGMAMGDRNEDEIIKDHHYYNKKFLISVLIPDGWTAVINHKTYTSIFSHPNEYFLVYLNVEPLQRALTAAAYFKKFEKRLTRMGLKKTNANWADRRLPYGALAGVFSGNDRQKGSILVEGIAFVQGTNGFSFMCVSKKNDFEAFQAVAEAMVKGIEFISPKKADSLQPDRMRVHKVKRGETWTGIAKRYFGSSKKVGQLAEYNGLEVSGDLAVDTLLKIPPPSRLQ